MRIFLSYGHDEYIELAIRIKADLEARGHEVWFDQERIMPGGDYEFYIEEGLNWCAALPENRRMVLFMTPHSVRRPDGYCLNEITAALNRNIRIIPVMVVDCEPPLSICRIQWLDMTDCVPVAERAERYEFKLNRLVEALEKGTIDFEGTHAYLHHHLKPLDFASELARHVPKFTGRKWVFEQIDAWLTSPTESRLFWITGPPGVGKTAIAAYLSHKRHEVGAFHLCQHGHDDKSDPRRCVMSLAYQLSSQLRDYQKRLAAMDLSEEVRKSPATLFDNLIIQPLVPLFPTPSRAILIVIDALDEATQNGRNYLAEFIAEAFPLTPHWLRLVITSRQEPEVMHPLQGLSPYHLDAALPENLADIRMYLRKNLPMCLHGQTSDEHLINTILRKSDGLFLYVEQVLMDLKEGIFSPDRLEEFPKGLGGIFRGFFARQFPDVTLYKKRYRPLLAMIVAAKDPLPIELAQAALQWDEYSCQEVLVHLGSLFPQVHRDISPFHQSIADWLTAPALAGSCFIDVHEGHKHLANACWSEYQAGVDSMSTYSLAHLPTHLMEVDRWDDLLDLVTCPKLLLIAKWIGEGEGDKGLTCLTRLIKFLEKKNQQHVTSAGLATQVARIHSLRGEYDDAEYWLNHALSLTSWRYGRRAKAIAFHELGSLRLYQGDLTEALRLYRKALRLCLWGIPVYHDEAAANLIGLATVFRTMYRLSKTVRYAKRGIREATLAKDFSHIIAAERLLAFAHTILGNYTEAELHLQSTSSMCEKYGEAIENLRLKLLWGWFEYDRAILQGKISEKARSYFEEALAEAQKVHDFYCTIEAKTGLGQCALERGATEEAKNWFDPLREGLASGRHPDLQASVKRGLASVLHQQGELEAAGNLYEEAINFCDQNNIPGIRTRIGLGAVQWHLGQDEKAKTTWKKALELSERISKARRVLAEIRIKCCQSDPHVTPW